MEFSKEKTAERIKVMQAYIDGKEIEFYNETMNIWQRVSGKPFWESSVEYRVKPEPKYRPFKDADEAFQEAKKHGFWCKIGGEYNQITEITDKEICFTIDLVYTKKGTLFGECLNYVWADTKEPCGILEE